MTIIHRTLVLASFFTITAQSLPAAVVAYWNFNNLNISGANTPGTGGVPTTIAADQGSGSLDLSSWAGTVDDYAGSSLNTLNSDTASKSLSLLAASGSPYPGNKSFITLQFSMTGLSDPSLSFATQGTSTGFNSNQLSYSIDGSNFTNISSPFTPDSSYSTQTFDLSSINDLDGASSATIKITFSGASGSTGNNRIDNLQLNAIPEPSTLVLVCLGLTALTFHRPQRS